MRVHRKCAELPQISLSLHYLYFQVPAFVIFTKLTVTQILSAMGGNEGIKLHTDLIKMGCVVLSITLSRESS
jgi:hypothetical protein